MFSLSIFLISPFSLFFFFEHFIFEALSSMKNNYVNIYCMRIFYILVSVCGNYI